MRTLITLLFFLVPAVSSAHTVSIGGTAIEIPIDHHSELVFRNVYGIMASWSFVKSGMDTDFVAAMIEKL